MSETKILRDPVRKWRVQQLIAELLCHPSDNFVILCAHQVDQACSPWTYEFRVYDSEYSTTNIEADVFV